MFKYFACEEIIIQFFNRVVYLTMNEELFEKASVSVLLNSTLKRGSCILLPLSVSNSISMLANRSH